MRYCGQTKRLCDRLILSQAVTFAGNTLTINIPEGSYADGCQYCIVVAQPIPAATTIGAVVVVTIGDGTATYPLTNSCCAQLTACSIRTRTKYPVMVSTNSTGGIFKVMGKVACAPNNALTAINGMDGGAGA